IFFWSCKMGGASLRCATKEWTRRCNKTNREQAQGEKKQKQGRGGEREKEMNRSPLRSYCGRCDESHLTPGSSPVPLSALEATMFQSRSVSLLSSSASLIWAGVNALGKSLLFA